MAQAEYDRIICDINHAYTDFVNAKDNDIRFTYQAERLVLHIPSGRMSDLKSENRFGMTPMYFLKEFYPHTAIATNTGVSSDCFRFTKQIG